MAGPCLLAISTRRPPLCRSLPGRRKGRRNGAEHHPKRVEALKENGRYEHGWIGTTSWGNIERRRNLDVIFLPKKFLHAVYSVFWIVNSVLGYGFLQQGRVGLLGIVKRLCFHLRRILDVDGDGRASISCYARGLLDDEHGVFRRGPEAGARVQAASTASPSMSRWSARPVAYSWTVRSIVPFISAAASRISCAFSPLTPTSASFSIASSSSAVWTTPPASLATPAVTAPKTAIVRATSPRGASVKRSLPVTAS